MPAAAAVASVSPRPFGDLAHTAANDLAELAGSFGPGTRPSRMQRQAATREILDYLAEFAGGTWQQRWDASPLGKGEFGAVALDASRGATYGLSLGVRQLFCLRAIQPSLLAFRRHPFSGYNILFVAAQNDPLLDKYVEHVKAHPMSHQHQSDAIADLCSLLTVQGVALADVTPESLLHHGHANRAARAVLHPGEKVANRFICRGAWNVLHRMGHFPPTTPQTMREAMLRGQQTVTELVDRYPVQNAAVRELLIEYLTRRRADSDYSTLTTLVINLVRNFWCRIEQLNPGQPDLRIPPEVYATWRDQIRFRDDGTPRLQVDDVVIGVRSFYLDLHTWAAEEPERWAAWVAPCPVPPTDIRGLGARRRRINERSTDRTRVRQPLLPVLVAHVEARHEHAVRLRAEAATADEGQTFTVDGRGYRRYISDTDRGHLKAGRPAVIRVQELSSGAAINTENEDEEAFWDWAVVETLRHSGLRIEELCELTHLSIRQYQRANGEVIALLVVAPSKTDRERVIPMSADLFHVIASIIRRHTTGGRTIPLLRRFDALDKVWSAALPFLFQRRNGTTATVTSGGTILLRLRRVCTAIAGYNPAFANLRFTPHDFRRIFATELVNSGLPIHIGAALLGHLNIQTTRGYVAVFDEDVIRHYQAHLQQRRQVRPDDEYTPVAESEWAEFEEHFDKRKVELGSCARPYGTPCQHEHACIRCPMLHVNPKMITRLDELEHDLLARRQHAQRENWLGEIEGIDLTLTYLRAKREEAERLTRRPIIQLSPPRARGDGD
ncbi:tyrosine-type recombinase/integrase [Micromonospora rubida]|uniref:tyrosine-type recombinase/integrase n=1 Tax=Micromonospora rubida TaxID=2697657 RepID=UPI001377ADA0|nr:site-specific integrase [Micromonospora rubida]NBE83390.1 tyrosine-type recombinase/integrase [Micromonospora rubida]